MFISVAIGQCCTLVLVKDTQSRVAVLSRLIKHLDEGRLNSFNTIINNLLKFFYVI